jgi:hypothetical protein
MAYADLTTEQKESVQAMCQLVRPLSGELGRLLEKFQAVASYYTGNVETILTELQSSDVVPNASGLAGAQDVTKAELVSIVGYFLTLCATPEASSGSYNTDYHRALYAKACGPTNLLVS